MKASIPIIAASALALTIATANAGELNVTGHLNVASNLTVHAVTLGGETRTNWPSGGGTSSGADNLTTAMLDFTQSENLFRFTLTNNTTWVFTNHVEGREIKLKVIQDATGGWTNNWPANLLWPGGQTVHVSTHANHFDLFKIVDDGDQWLATVEGSDYRTPCTTNCNYALQFDGANYVSTGGSSDLFPAEWTMECWIKDSGSADGSGYFGATAGSNGDGWYFHSGDMIQTVAFRWNDGGMQLALDSYPVSIGDDVWHHIAASFDGTTARLFVDGSLTASDTPSLTTPTTQDLGLSCLGFYGNRADVTLDEVRISSVARYTSGFTPAHSFTVDSDTVAYYKFNEGSGSTAHDETSNFDATLHGSPEPSWEEGD